MGDRVLLERLYRKYAGICQACGKRTTRKRPAPGKPMDDCASIGHLRPSTFGGTRSMRNSRLECHGCNTQHGARLGRDLRNV